MSVRMMSLVFERYPKGGGEMVLALALADYAEDDGTRVFPSIESLAKKTRQSRRTIQYQLRRMEESGWLILVNSGNGGRNQSREYVINPRWIAGEDIFAEQKESEKEKGANSAPPKKGANHDTKGASCDMKGRNSRQERAQPVAPAYTHHRSINDPPKTHQRERAKKTADGFEEFWQAYPNTPRRVAKKKCRERWKSRKLDEIADQIIDHVRAMALTRQWQEGYEPAPMTYINQSRWEDGVPEESATNQRAYGKQERFDPVEYINRNRISKQQPKMEELDVIDC